MSHSKPHFFDLIQTVHKATGNDHKIENFDAGQAVFEAKNALFKDLLLLRLASDKVNGLDSSILGTSEEKLARAYKQANLVEGNATAELKVQKFKLICEDILDENLGRQEGVSR